MIWGGLHFCFLQVLHVSVIFRPSKTGRKLVNSPASRRNAATFDAVMQRSVKQGLLQGTGWRLGLGMAHAKALNSVCTSPDADQDAVYLMI